MKRTESDLLLKNFLEEFFDFYTLRRVGFFPKDMKKSDIYGQSKRICYYFGYESIYEYRSHTVRAHLSYEEGNRPLHIDEQGSLKEEPFVSEFKGIYD